MRQDRQEITQTGARLMLWRVANAATALMPPIAEVNHVQENRCLGFAPSAGTPGSSAQDAPDPNMQVAAAQKLAAGVLPDRGAYRRCRGRDPDPDAGNDARSDGRDHRAGGPRRGSRARSARWASSSRLPTPPSSRGPRRPRFARSLPARATGWRERRVNGLPRTETAGCHEAPAVFSWWHGRTDLPEN